VKYKQDGITFIEVKYRRKFLLGSRKLVTFVEGLSSDFDVIYFAKHTPPIFDDLPPYHLQTLSPVVYCIHGPLFIREPSRATHKLLNLFAPIKLSMFKLLKLYDAFRVLNYDDYVIFKRLGFKAFYIPQGVDTEIFKPSKKYEQFTVCFFGSRFDKGVDLLPEIVHKVFSKAQDMRFILVDGGWAPSYKELISHKYPRNVSSLSRMPQKKFAKLLSKSHLLLFPSRYEGSPKTVIESLSSGTPVTAFSIPGPKEYLIRSPCRLLTPLDLDAMSKEILRYYSLWKREPDAFKKISRRCREHALRFDWNNIANLLHGMLEQTVEENT